MSSVKNADIAIKIVNGAIIGIKRFSVGKQVYFEKVYYPCSFEADNTESSKNISLVLPQEIISFKILTYPFKLKSNKNIDLLAKAAIEEYTPLNIDELIVIKHKLSQNSLLIEYVKRKTVAGLLNLHSLNNPHIYTPFSLLCEIGYSYLGNDYSGETAFVYNFLDKSYGIIFKNGTVAEIVDFRYLSGINNLDNNLLEYKTVIDLNAKVREIHPDISTALKDNPDNPAETDISSLDVASSNDLYVYSDLVFLLDLKSGQGKHNLKYIDSATLFNRPSSVDAYRKTAPLAITALIIFIFILAGLIEYNYYKSKEKTIIGNKINSILAGCIPGQKVFYEPRYAIKEYYDNIREKSGAYGGGSSFLNFLNYVSQEKSHIKSLEINGIGYSFKKFNFKGSVSGYKALHRFEVYLKKKYSSVDVLKTYKGLKGNIKFNVILKK